VSGEAELAAVAVVLRAQPHQDYLQRAAVLEELDLVQLREAPEARDELGEVDHGVDGVADGLSHHQPAVRLVHGGQAEGHPLVRAVLLLGLPQLVDCLAHQLPHEASERERHLVRLHAASHDLFEEVCAAVGAFGGLQALWGVIGELGHALGGAVGLPAIAIGVYGAAKVVKITGDVVMMLINITVVENIMLLLLLLLLLV